MIKIQWPKINSTSYIGYIHLGNGITYKIYCFHKLGKFVLAIQEKGCYDFLATKPVSKELVAEKLLIESEENAAIVADFINCQIKRYSTQQGTYNAELIAKARATMPAIHKCGCYMIPFVT